MRYRSVVPLNSAPDIEKPIPRVRLHKLSHEARLLADTLGIWDGDTIAEVKKRIEQLMKTLNENQRRALLANIGRLFEP